MNNKLKRIVKKIGVLTLATLSVSTFIYLAGCSSNVNHSIPTSPTTIPTTPTNPTPIVPTETNPLPTTKPNPVNETEKKAKEFFESLQNGNYTAVLTQGDLIRKEECDGSVAKITVDSEIAYAQNKNGENYSINFEDGLWVSEKSAESLSLFYDFGTRISTATIETAREDVVTGKLENKDYVLNLNGYTFSYDGGVVQFSDVNQTSVSLPEDVWTVDFDSTKINKSIKNLPTNFVCIINENGVEKTLTVDDNKYIEDGDENVVYVNEDDKWFVYTNENGTWTKSTTDKTFSTNFVDTIKAFSVSLYNQSSDTYLINYSSSEDNQSKVTAKIGENSMSFDVDDETIVTLENIGNTAVELPTEYVDNVTTIYTIDENGNYNFDIVELKKVFMKFLVDDGGYSKLISSMSKFDKLVYIYASKTEISLGYISLYNSTGNQYYQILRINDTTFYKNISKYKKANAFYNYLNSMSSSKLYFGASTKLDLTTTDEQMSKLTKNVFNRLSEVGYQETSINNEGTKVEGLKPENVLFCFKGVSSGVTDDYGLIDKKDYSLYYLILVDEEIKVLQVDVSATIVCDVIDGLDSNQSAIENVANNCEGKWFVRNYKEYKVNSDNKKLYEEEIKINNE